MSTFVIAEAGSCHDNDIIRVYELVEVAQASGADACKFQYWSNPRRLADRRNALDYFPIYSKYQIPEWWLEQLRLECVSWGIEFMCTVYLPEDIATIAPYVKRFKIASFEALDDDFIADHGPYNKEVIISTGMSSAKNPVIWSPAVRNAKFLHCVSAYPCPLEQANLAALREGQYQTGRYFAGYSDHTHNVLTGALAVAAGAKILEVHFRLDDTDPANPDYTTALSPGQLKDYIALVRQAEVMMGSGLKEPQPAEAEMMKYRVRK